MKPKQIVKITVDILMTVVLLFLMAYSLIGEEAHEWLGLGMFVLFILHHILNNRWSKNLLKGKYTPFRILQTALVVLALASMVGSMVSGIVLSRYALAFLPITGGSSWARTLHMLSAYWGFTFISLHIGVHWGMMIGMTKKLFANPSVLRSRIVQALGLLVAGYGARAFVVRDIDSYMFLKIPFVYFDFDEPILYFLLDYMAVMGLFVWIGYYVSRGLKRYGKETQD